MESPIEEFYKNKSVLLTGFSGFLGQIITERLVRCCDVDKIYVLIRNKKGKTWQNRVYDIFKDPLFDRVRKEKPNFAEKIVGVVGDCDLVNLGMCAEDIKSIQKAVNVVIHAAAIVKFDDKLSNSLKVNVKATKCLLEMSKEIKNLQAFVYVSTAYSNCNQSVIDEAFYKPKISANDMLNLLEFMDEGLLNEISADLIKGFPNTYTFSKHLAEDMIKSYAGQLPIVVFRPAIVMPSFQEPVSGWINNYYGPVGLMYGISMGAIHVFRIKSDAFAEVVPVDMVVSCLLASVWDIGRNSYQTIPVYNFVPKRTNSLTWGKFLTLNFTEAENFPVSKAYWYFAFEMVEDPIKFKILHFFYHTLPAVVVDFVLRIANVKFRLMRLYSVVHKLNFALEPFVFGQWTWKDNNVVELWNKMNRSDQKNFPFDMQKLDWKEYLSTSLLGMRLYIAKDDPSSIPYSVKRNKVLKYIHYAVTWTIKGLALYLLALLCLQIYTLVIFPMFS